MTPHQKAFISQFLDASLPGYSIDFVCDRYAKGEYKDTPFTIAIGSGIEGKHKGKPFVITIGSEFTGSVGDEQTKRHQDLPSLLSEIVDLLKMSEDTENVSSL